MSDYTALIKAKGWKVKDALAYWGRGQDWYIENRKGDEFAQRRLRCLIDGLDSGDARKWREAMIAKSWVEYYRENPELQSPHAIKTRNTDLTPLLAMLAIDDEDE